MNRPVRRHPSLALLPIAIASVLVSACGGGGGDGGAPASQSINEQNARATARTAYVAVDSVSVLGSAALDAPQATKSLESRADRSFTRLAIDGTRRAASMGALPTNAGPPSGAVAAKAVSSETEACSSGGSLTLTVDDADNDGKPSAPDSIVLRFDSCAENGVLLNGALSLTGLSSVTAGNGQSGTDAATVAFDQLSVTAEGITETANGGFTMQWSWSENPESYELTLSGQSIRITGPSGFSELAGFSYRETGDAARYGFSIDATMRTALGAHQLSTPTPFAGYYGDHPSSGSLLVRASDGSQLAVTALSTTEVRLDVDANGDGQFESSEQMSWDALAAADG